MNRLTIKEKNRYNINGDIETAIQRLGIFEDAYEDLMNSQDQLTKDLEELKIQGKEKTVRYRESMGRKLINSYIITFFEKLGV